MTIETTTTDTPNIVEKIENYLNTYMVFANPNHARVIALWVLHTYTFSDSFPQSPMTTPYLYINSTDPGSGKTLLIDLLEPICLNSERTIDMTASTLFRLIESIHPTMFIDEVDAVWSGAKNEGLRGVLNGGYKHSGYVWRTQGEEPVKFHTFSPKLLAGIDNGELPATVATRSIEIVLQRVAKLDDDGRIIAPDGTTRELYYSFMAEEIAAELCEEISAFMRDWKANYSRYMPKPIPGIAPRQFELAFPLLQVAHAVGMEESARAAITDTIKNKPRRDDNDVRMLREIRDLFAERNTDRLSTADIGARLGLPEGGSSAGKLLSSRLKRFGIGQSTTMTFPGERPAKGFYRHQFQHAFDNYL